MKELTACFNLLTTLYGYAFQLREDIMEIETTIFDTRTILLEFYEKEVVHEEHFAILIQNLKENLEKMNQIFISNEQNFKFWTPHDKISLYECDFLMKQQKEVLEKEYLKHEHLLDCFDEEHHDAMEFWKRNFGTNKFVEKNAFFERYEKENGKINPKALEVMKYYIDYDRNGLVSVYKFYKFLNYFGNFGSFVNNIQSLLDKKIYIFSISSIKANPKLTSSKKGSYIIRFSKSHSNCFAISFKNIKSEIKQFLINCSKQGLKLKNSEKIYPNISEFISAHSNALKHNLDKDKVGIDMNLNDKIREINQRKDPRDKTKVADKQGFCCQCKKAITDSV